MTPDWNQRPVDLRENPENRYTPSASNPWQLFVDVAQLHGPSSPKARQAYAELRAYTKEHGIATAGSPRRRARPKAVAA